MVAIKEIELDNDENVLRESRIMKICIHENLVSIIDNFTLDHPLFENTKEKINDIKYHYIVMELCDTDLYKYAKEKYENDEIIEEKEIYDIFKQLLQGLYYLLKIEKIFHRDLKLENFLIKKENNITKIKISDYGLSKSIIDNEEFNSTVGTSIYMAPEVSFNQLKGKYSISADMYSLGVCLYYLSTGSFTPKRNEDTLWTMVYTNMENKLIFPNYLSKDFISILKRMLEIDDEKRITWDELFSHSFILNTLKCNFVDFKQTFYHSKLPKPQKISNLPSKYSDVEMRKTPNNCFEFEITENQNEDVDDFDEIILCFKSDEQIFDDEWSEILSSYKNLDIVISNIKITEDCLSSFIEFIKSNINNSIDLPNSIYFNKCHIPHSLKDDIVVLSDFNIIFNPFSTFYYYCLFYF